jgi:hypothetical protein
LIINQSCKQEPTFKEKVENFVTDSLLTNFNDPKSFEFVSTTIDTFTIKDAVKNQQDYQQIASGLIDSIESSRNLREIDSLKKLNQDDIINLQISIKYRAKNKINATILDNMLIIYDPKTNKFDPIRLQDEK